MLLFTFLKKSVNLLLIVLMLALYSCSSTKNTKSSRSNTTAIKKKYAKKLSVPVNEIKNVKLYSEIDNWIGVPYRYGGMSKKGVDCSGFINIVYKKVYKTTVPRTTTDLAKKMKKIGKKRIKEGDLVFFNTIKKKKNSHVGIYLKNGMFAHASTSRGVTISSLGNPYYKKRFSKSGRFK